MTKRAVEEVFVENSRLTKRPRIPHDKDWISRLSDELLLRVLSNLEVDTLLACQQVSPKLRSIAGDSELWKSLYYDRFVGPRKRRYTRRRSQTLSSASMSTKLSKWLDEQDLLKASNKTNWKQQYKLRLNWARGRCDLSEITVASRPPVPPLLAKLHRGIVYTVDSSAGLRAWSYKGEQRLIACLENEKRSGSTDAIRPTSFTVDIDPRPQYCSRLAIGYADGSFSIQVFSSIDESLRSVCKHPPSVNGPLVSLALAWPYFLTITDANLLSLYRLSRVSVSESPEYIHESASKCSPILLASLKSHSVWPPLSLALKQQGVEVVASIAYSFPTFTSGWSVGIQEIRLNAKGEVVQSRIASEQEQGFVSLASVPTTTQTPSTASVRPSNVSRPTSLSYSHPYLLVSHSDNTLTVYSVTSNASKLYISAGKRLWGHTSSIFGAHIGRRGKAISVSSRGDEIRIWELEGSASRSTQGRSEFGVQVIPEKRASTIATNACGVVPAEDRISAAADSLDRLDEMAITRAWVGFDDESVIVLKEHKKGNQALTVYDFT